MRSHRWTYTHRLVGGATAGVVALVLAATGCAGDDESASGASTVAGGVAAQPVPTGQDTATPVRTITVQGEGSVTVKPDTAHVQMGVQVSGERAQEVLDQANEKAAALIAALRQLGVAEDDLRTTQISIYPQYDTNGRRVVGYQASNSLDVTIRDLTRAGEIIDGAAGVTDDAITIGGISFSVADTEAVLSAAREDAIANARKRAAEYAGAAGAEVGAVLTISEVSMDEPQPIYYEEARAGADSAVPVQAGTTDLSASVTVVFELQPS